MPAFDANDHETKYLVSAGMAVPVQSYLSGVCASEIPFAANWVDSIYFDTLDLDAYQDNLSGQLLKTKVRVRWYDQSGVAFAEIKRRCAERRDKTRVELSWSGERLSREGLSCPLLATLGRVLSERGQPVPSEVRPVVHLRFHRRRSVERSGSARISLDTEIGLVAIASRLGAGDPGVFPGAVVELKGATSVLPVALRPLHAFGCRRASFSKYAACLGAAALGGWQS